MCLLREAGNKDGILGQGILRMTMQLEIPDGAAWVLRSLREAGYEAYVVGGCVRDSLLCRVPDDWDITTSARPEEVKRVFHRTVDTGIQHGTVTVMVGKDAYEVTTYRVDGEYADGRHPTSVTFTPSLVEDLKRRDFTINAMAYCPEKGLVDEFDGEYDLQRGIIRAVGDPMQRFTEDALRMMRAVRFAAQLNAEIESNTAEAIRRLAPNLRLVSAERVRTELEKLVVSGHPEKLSEAYRLGLMDIFLPELSECMCCVQNNPHHCYTVGEHILHSVMAVRRERILRLTMLLHDIGKPEVKTTDGDGIDHFHGHVPRSAELADAILRRLKYDNDTRKRVTTLVAWHDRQLGDSKVGVRRNVAQLGAELFPVLMEIKRADVAAQSDYQRKSKLAKIDQWEKSYQEILEERDCLCIRDLAVGGKDLMEKGVRPGQQMGQILQDMLEEVLRNPEHNTREWLLNNCVSGTGESRNIPEKG